MQDETAAPPSDEPLQPGENWKQSYPPDSYRELADHLAHFSLKTTNTNAPAGGVRVSAAEALDLPYVSVRTLLACGREVPVDYIGNAAQFARIASQVNGFERGSARPPSLDEERSITEAMDGVRTTSRAFGLTPVAVRVRQLLIENADAPSGYVAVTPMNSAGLGALIRDEFVARNKSRKDQGLPQLKVGNLLWGGSNPQNIGGRVRDMQRALYFAPPRSNASYRRALAIHYRGISLRPRREDLARYRDVKVAISAQNDGELPSTATQRAREQWHLQHIVAVIQERAETAYNTLLKSRAALPGKGKPLLSSLVRPAVRALIDPDERYPGWTADCALEIGRLVENYKTDKKLGVLAIRGRSLDSFVSMVEEAL